jgi:hypothetical protein
MGNWVITDRLGYLLNRSCPAQRVALGRSDLAELKQPPGPMTFSYRSCSTYVNSPDGPLSLTAAISFVPLARRHRVHLPLWISRLGDVVAGQRCRKPPSRDQIVMPPTKRLLHVGRLLVSRTLLLRPGRADPRAGLESAAMASPSVPIRPARASKSPRSWPVMAAALPWPSIPPSPQRPMARPHCGRASCRADGLRNLAAGRADLLAQVCGIFEGAFQGRPDEPLARQAASRCRLAGADAALIPQWAAEGRSRAQAARQPSHGGRPA